VTAGAGVRISRLLAFCCKQGLSGLEILSGVPGTVGGAVWAMRVPGRLAGRSPDPGPPSHPRGRRAQLRREQIPFRYRCSGLPSGSVVIQAVFGLAWGDPAIIRRQISRWLVLRNAAQPVEFRCAGSIFKNPPGEYAGRLVDAAGIKGTRVGGAMISPKHGNFVVNLGGARAADVLALVTLAQERVRAMAGIELELEMQVMGED